MSAATSGRDDFRPSSPLRLDEIKTDRLRRRHAPSSASIQTLQAELDSFLTWDEKEYVDSVVRQKAGEFAREVAAKRRLRATIKSPTPSKAAACTRRGQLRRASSATVLPHSNQTRRGSTPCLELSKSATSPPRRSSSFLGPSPGDRTVLSAPPRQSNPLEGRREDGAPALPPVDVPPHHASLQLEHMLTREVHAQKHRQAMEHFAIKLETEAAAWKQKYADAVVESMRSAALEAEVATLKAANAQLAREVQAAKGKLDDVAAQLHQARTSLDTTERQTQAMTMDVLDQTRLTNNEFEERLIQEQLTSAELREVVQHCVRQMEEMARKELAPLSKAPDAVDAEKNRSARRHGIRKREALAIARVRGTDDYMHPCPWMQLRGLFGALSKETWPVEFQERLWQARSDAAVHQRWMDAVVATCSLPDDMLALWSPASVLETTNALWVDKLLEDTRHAAAKQPTQSLPKFTWCWFLQKFTSRPVAAAQLYLFTVGLIEHKNAHPRVEVMAALLGLSGVKVYLPRLADCLLNIVVALIPLPTLAGVLATSLVKPALFDLAAIEAALAEVFVTIERVGSTSASQLPRSHPFNRVLVSAESHDRMTEILGSEASKASHQAWTASAVWADEDSGGTSTARSALNTTRTNASSRTTATHSSNLVSSRRRQSLRGKKVQLQLEVVLRLAVHIWLHQATQDQDALTAQLQHEDSSEALDLKEFKTACGTHFPHEFTDREVFDMFETASLHQASFNQEAHVKNVELGYLVRVLLALGYTRPTATDKANTSR